MRENNAQKKWCPLAQIAFAHDPKTIQNCIASDCMMWTWDTDVEGHCGVIIGNYINCYVKGR